MSVATDETTDETTEPEPDETTTEPEPDEDAEPDEQTTEPEPEPEPAALSEKDMEKLQGKLENERNRHAARIGEIMGEDAQALEQCPFCEPAMPGFYFPGHVEEDAKAATLAALGLGVLNEYVTDEQTHECDYCSGMGETKTGSKVPEQITRVCPKCGGNGWLTDQGETEWKSRQIASGAIQPPAAVLVDAPLIEQPTMPVDQYQRPFGHPNYGIPEVYLTPEQRDADEYIPKG